MPKDSLVLQKQSGGCAFGLDDSGLAVACFVRGG